MAYFIPLNRLAIESIKYGMDSACWCREVHVGLHNSLDTAL